MAPWPIPWFLGQLRQADDQDKTLSVLPDCTKRFVSRLKVPPDRSTGTEKSTKSPLNAANSSQKSVKSSPDLSGKPSTIERDAKSRVLPDTQAKSSLDSSSRNSAIEIDAKSQVLAKSSSDRNSAIEIDAKSPLLAKSSGRNSATEIDTRTGGKSSNRNSSVVYLLSAESLSERSAFDAAELIRIAKPGAVVAQIEPGALAELRSEDSSSVGGDLSDRVPTNVLGVIGACFLDSTQRVSFENRARIDVLRTIFGVTYHGHVLSARNAAKETNAPFLYLETPDLQNSPSNRRSFGTFTTDSLQKLGFSVARYASDKHEKREQTGTNYPTYATSFYDFLVELQDAYRDLPGMNHALQHARTLLFDVEQGRTIDQEELIGAQNFRLAVEGLRIGLTNLDQGKQQKGPAQKFEELSLEEKGYVLLAQAIQDQARVYGTVVAVVKASSIAGIRRHWNTVVPPEIVERARQCFVFSEYGDEELKFKESGLEKTLAGAAVGIAVLPCATPMTKVLIFKAPAFVKLGLVQMKRNFTVLVAKSLAPVFTPGQTFTAVVKTITSAGKARAAAHSVVATAERATFSAIRTAFYCLMRQKQGMSAGGRPGLLLGGSVVAGAAILWCGDRLEAAIESAPVAPTVARLGRGLENLESASKCLSEESPRNKRWEDLYKSLHKR